MFDTSVYRNLVLAFLALVAISQVYKLYHVYSNNNSQISALRDLTWSDINFIHTTDTHGWYSGHLNQKIYSADWGEFISFTSRLKEIANENNQDLLLIDSGDRHDGNGLSDVTVPNGVKSLPIFMKEDYDLLTIGNHELYLWENSRQEYEVLIEHFKGNYLSSNVQFKLDNGTFVSFGDKFKYFTTPNQKLNVLSFGFLFDFDRFNDHSKVTSIKEVIDNEPWFKEILKSYPPDKVDLLLLVTHVPISRSWPELYYLHTVLREFYPTTKIQYFGGHSHIRDFIVLDPNATALQSGRYCETIGWTSINLTTEKFDDRYSRTYIDFNIDSFQHHSKITTKSLFDTERGIEVSNLIKTTRKELKLNDPIGYVKSSNYYIDYVPITDSKNIFHLLTKKILPTLVTENENITTHDERIIIINTGSIRYDLYKGAYTIDSQYIVSPFENLWVKLTLPKGIAIQIAPILNDQGYIAKHLTPPHHMDDAENKNSLKRQTRFRYPVLDLTEADKQTIKNSKKKAKLTKGYVTFDDLGHDGDDTPHKAVVNFPIPNVVDSQELKKGTPNDELVDLVFYDFIQKDIFWALQQLNYTLEEDSNEPEFYSKKYLGTLLNEYIKDKGL
ncbi:Metallo-dependent phosphatase-like protein [Scheffersomyces coipomensis]|uniref:Metallo-dependent phosphatase-like protein n=1 Tax=Scheffersomyces coipomensis TaxID=1788519 RepID=UPI00315D7B7D